MKKEVLCEELRKIISKVLEVDKLDLGNFDDLSKSNLEIDSIAVLEIELRIKKEYGIKTERLPKEVFFSIDSMAGFIMNQKR